MNCPNCGNKFLPKDQTPKPGYLKGVICPCGTWLYKGVDIKCNLMTAASILLLWLLMIPLLAVAPAGVWRWVIYAIFSLTGYMHLLIAKRTTKYVLKPSAKQLIIIEVFLNFCVIVLLTVNAMNFAEWGLGYYHQFQNQTMVAEKTSPYGSRLISEGITPSNREMLFWVSSYTGEDTYDVTLFVYDFHKRSFRKIDLGNQKVPRANIQLDLEEKNIYLFFKEYDQFESVGITVDFQTGEILSEEKTPDPKELLNGKSITLKDPYSYVSNDSKYSVVDNKWDELSIVENATGKVIKRIVGPNINHYSWLPDRNVLFYGVTYPHYQKISIVPGKKNQYYALHLDE